MNVTVIKTAFIALAAATLLTGCNATGDGSDPVKVVAAGTTATNPNNGVTAFRDICLANAPTFADTAKAAAKFGVKLKSGAVSGTNKDKSISVQYLPDVECSVTTPSQPGEATRLEYLGVIAVFTNKATQTPAAGSVNNVNFVFTHERGANETYAMLKK